MMKNYQAPHDHLKNRVILVTGAAQGLGKTAAIAFAKQGATVILLDKPEKEAKQATKLDETYDAILAAGCPQALIFPMDLEKASEEDFKNMAEGIYQQLGRLDGILHNATQFNNLSPLAIQTAAQFEQMFKVNVVAPFALTKACLPLLQRAEDASIIFTSNSAAREAKPFWGSHGISKVAADTMMKMWAEEIHGANIRFNSLVPGALQSPQRKKTHPGELHADLPPMESAMPLYLYLMGSDSKGTTGQIFAC
ncbi:MAG: putative oxidoreductase YciK [Pseudomonadota bacterium]|jgi:NAD(P)-dependent dehydrogenase (short-subunit alcohol dehydrogenase family)